MSIAPFRSARTRKVVQGRVTSWGGGGWGGVGGGGTAARGHRDCPLPRGGRASSLPSPSPYARTTGDACGEAPARGHAAPPTGARCVGGEARQGETGEVTPNPPPPLPPDQPLVEWASGAAWWPAPGTAARVGAPPPHGGVHPAVRASPVSTHAAAGRSARRGGSQRGPRHGRAPARRRRGRGTP